MIKQLLIATFVLLTGAMSLAESTTVSYDFTGHVTFKNSLPEPLTITMFEGEFQMAPADEDTTALKAAIKAQGLELESEIFYSLKNEQPHLLLMVVKKDGVSNIMFLDLVEKGRYFYNISKIEDGKLISSNPNYTDYVLEVKRTK